MNAETAQRPLLPAWASALRALAELRQMQPDIVVAARSALHISTHNG